MCFSFPPSLTMIDLCITQCTYWTPSVSLTHNSLQYPSPLTSANFSPSSLPALLGNAPHGRQSCGLGLRPPRFLAGGRGGRRGVAGGRGWVVIYYYILSCAGS